MGITAACHKDKVYLVTASAIKPNQLFSYDLTAMGETLTQVVNFPPVQNGRMGLFRGQLTLFGGYTMPGGLMAEPIPVKTMQVFDESKNLWDEKPFEMKQIQWRF